MRVVTKVRMGGRDGTRTEPWQLTGRQRFDLGSGRQVTMRTRSATKPRRRSERL